MMDHGFGVWMASIVAAAVVVTCGCREQGNQDQDLPHNEEEPGPASTEATEPQVPVAVSTVGPWSEPAGWVHDPTPRQMRLATYLVDDDAGQIEIAITRFPGRVGGDLANVNRWRRQMGHAPLGPDELEATLRRFDLDGFQAFETRIEDDQRALLVIALYETDQDRSWFVRATVSPEIADRLHPQMLEFAESFQAASGSTGAPRGG